MTIEESVSLLIKLLTSCEDVVPHSILWITKRQWYTTFLQFCYTLSLANMLFLTFCKCYSSERGNLVLCIGSQAQAYHGATWSIWSRKQIPEKKHALASSRIHFFQMNSISFKMNSSSEQEYIHIDILAGTQKGQSALQGSQFLKSEMRV